MMADEKLQNQLTALLEAAASAEGAQNALSLMFPRVEKALDTNIVSDVEESAERQRHRRISQRDFAAGYFRLNADFASWSMPELNSILDQPTPNLAFADAINRLSYAPESDRLKLSQLFLEALDGAFGIYRPFTVDWLRALVDTSPYFIQIDRDKSGGIFEASNFQRLKWILNRALREFLPDHRYVFFQNVVPEASDVSLLCDFYRSRVGDTNPKGGTSDSDRQYFGNSTEHLRTMLLARVRGIAASGRFWSQALPGPILWFWWGCDQEEEVLSFTAEALKTDIGLASLLVVPISIVHSSAGNYEHVSRRQWSMIVNLESLAERAGEILSSKIANSDRAAAKRFLEALKKDDEDRFK